MCKLGWKDDYVALDKPIESIQTYRPRSKFYFQITECASICTVDCRYSFLEYTQCALRYKWSSYRCVITNNRGLNSTYRPTSTNPITCNRVITNRSILAPSSSVPKRDLNLVTSSTNAIEFVKLRLDYSDWGKPNKWAKQIFHENTWNNLSINWTKRIIRKISRWLAE